jgi:hypothetical protein
MPQPVIAGLPQSIRDTIETMYGDYSTFREIHEWLLSLGYSDVTFNMVKYWCRSRIGIREPYEHIEPADTYEGRLSQHVDAIAAAGLEVFTLNRIRLRGTIWSKSTLALRRAGLIDADNNKGSRHRLLVSFDELREWRDWKLSDGG